MSDKPMPSELATLLRDANSVLARYPLAATPNQLRPIIERLRDTVVVLRDMVYPPDQRGAA